MSGTHAQVRAKTKADGYLTLTRWFLLAAIITQVLMLLIFLPGDVFETLAMGTVLFLIVAGSFCLGVLCERYDG